jgi:hypothetical protein
MPAKAMFLLGQNPDSDNQVWHLPTAPVLTGKQFIEMAATIYKTKPSYFSLRKWMLWVIGKFMKVVAGTVEMYYQYDHDYIFDSSKFEKRFNFKPTPYAEGIKRMSETLYKGGVGRVRKSAEVGKSVRSFVFLLLDFQTFRLRTPSFGLPSFPTNLHICTSAYLHIYKP